MEGKKRLQDAGPNESWGICCMCYEDLSSISPLVVLEKTIVYNNIETLNKINIFQ